VPIEVRRFRDTDVAAIVGLNARLAAARLPHDVGWEERIGEPTLQTQPIIERLYVAAQGDEVRGGVWLKEQMFWSHAGLIRAGWAKYPVSESLIDGSAAGVPASLLFGLLRQQPNLMALGMGGHSGPFARLLAAMRWTSSPVPFFVRLLRPARVLRQIAYARKTRLRRLAADALAWSGLASGTTRALSALRAATAPNPAMACVISVAPRFDAWVDDLWERCRGSYGFVAVRDSRALNALYPERFNRLTRLRVQREGVDIGWICPRSIDARGTWFEKDFGSLKLGIITDAFSQPADAAAVMAAGARYLTDEGVDLILTFQFHPAWCAAARTAGFLAGPSNCVFARASSVEQLIQTGAAANRHVHLTYSDGDGPEMV
jgi:hypothetical protein